MLTSIDASYFGQEFLWHQKNNLPKLPPFSLFRFFLSNVPLSGEQTVTCFRSPAKICGSSRTRFVLFPPTTLLADFVQKHFPSPAKGSGNMRRQIIWCSNSFGQKILYLAKLEVVINPEKGVGVRQTRGHAQSQPSLWKGWFTPMLYLIPLQPATF